MALRAREQRCSHVPIGEEDLACLDADILAAGHRTAREKVCLFLSWFFVLVPPSPCHGILMAVDLDPLIIEAASCARLAPRATAASALKVPDLGFLGHEAGGEHSRISY